MTAGPNTGGKSLYSLDPDGYIFEFHQRPPDARDATVARGPPTGRRSLEQYRLMALIRRFEERAAELFQQGVIFGTAHSCVGQEAIAVGAAGVMRDTDYLVGHHRSHGHLIAAGADLRRMMAEMFGKRTGYCKGLGGSMHIADLSLDILGCNGIVGAGIPHACGAALTAKLRGTGPGGGRLLRRRRRRAGRGARGDEPRRDLDAAGRLHLREQPVRALGRLARRSARSRISPTAPPATGCRARSSTATTCSPSRTPSRGRSRAPATAAARRSSR